MLQYLLLFGVLAISTVTVSSQNTTAKGCHSFAKAVIGKDGKSVCKCNDGYAGNGYECGSDSDQDGFPNEELNCTERTCRRDNCMMNYNPGQDDKDNNGIGDTCDDLVDADPFPESEITTSTEPDEISESHGIAHMASLGLQIEETVTIRPTTTTTKKPKSCDPQGSLQKMSNGTMLCKCNVGFAGNGFQCGADSDQDGFPNEALNCPEPTCKRDNCMMNYNPGQDDKDNNGIGDTCDESDLTL